MELTPLPFVIKRHQRHDPYSSPSYDDVIIMWTTPKRSIFWYSYVGLSQRNIDVVLYGLLRQSNKITVP
jgi:hypothetical protein